MRNHRIVRVGLLTAATVLGFLAIAAGIGHADTRYVATNGLDGPACGTPVSPCRSISQAIELAGVGGVSWWGPDGTVTSTPTATSAAWAKSRSTARASA